MSLAGYEWMHLQGYARGTWVIDDTGIVLVGQAMSEMGSVCETVKESARLTHSTGLTVAFN